MPIPVFESMQRQYFRWIWAARAVAFLSLSSCLGGLPDVAADEGPSNGLMHDLLAKGVEIAGAKVSLDPPRIDPGARVEDRAAAQKSLAGASGWKRFSRDSIVAPVRIQMSYLKNEKGERVGHRIHLAYVAHADIDTLRDAEVMGGLLSGGSAESKPDDEFHSETLDHDTLEKLGIDEGPFAFAWLDLLLLKKVEVQGVIRSERTSGENFFVVAWVLDERFTDRVPADDHYRNQWVRRSRDPAGKEVRSDPHSYSGAAGYLQVSEIGIGASDSEASDNGGRAALIEVEVVLHEPEGWFNGSSLLRSKLPLILQESARRLRRELKSRDKR